MINIELTGDQIEVVVRQELQDALEAGKLEPSLETSMILVLAYYSPPERLS